MTAAALTAGLRQVAHGAAGGVVATVAMTGVLLAARWAGLVAVPAPEAVVSGALERIHLDDEVRPPARTALVAVGHLAYGGALGAAYGALARRAGGSSLPRGAAYGLAVWAADYVLTLPALGILPRPSRQGRGRHVENVSGHLVYGATLGWMVEAVGGNVAMTDQRQEGP